MVSIVFLGDVMPGRFVDCKAVVDKDVSQYLENSAIRVINLEGVISSHCPSRSVIKSRLTDYTCKHGISVEQAKLLVELNVTCCNLANNHILDYGFEAVKDTINFLNTEDIKWFGFGKNYEVAWKPRLFSIKVPSSEIFHDDICSNLSNTGKSKVSLAKLKIAFFGMADHFVEWKACDRAGINYFDIKNFTTDGHGNPNLGDWTDIQNIQEHIKKVKKRCDVVIFSIHWGDNFQDTIDEVFRNFAHILIDSGADIIHGHSTHHTQGIEIYKSKLIIYGCGEFLNDYDMIEELLQAEGESLGPNYITYNSHLSFIYKLHLKAVDNEQKKVELSHLDMYPIEVKEGTVRRCMDSNRDILIEKMILDCDRLCTKVFIHDDVLRINF